MTFHARAWGVKDVRVCAGWLVNARERDHMAGLSRALLRAALSTGAGGMPGSIDAVTARCIPGSGAEKLHSTFVWVLQPGQSEGKALFGLSADRCCHCILVSGAGVGSLLCPEACPLAVCH